MRIDFSQKRFGVLSLKPQTGAMSSVQRVDLYRLTTVSALDLITGANSQGSALLPV